ncbi:MAG: glycosyltransferase [Rhodoferax sp.]|uniref:glycosyltransferase n=1 Tax=Rhodoferax sp. TaxID=50421 RepID=UPI002723513C|nr:glycosyltransferase [Rhodoferax sp.]MDO8450885.1 glycosyltransferase [Rhodoferax sp.]
MVDRLAEKGESVDVFFTGWLYEPDLAALNASPPAYGLHSKGERSRKPVRQDLSGRQRQFARLVRSVVRQLVLNWRRTIGKHTKPPPICYRRFGLQIHEPKLSDFYDEEVRRRFVSLCEQVRPDIVIVEYVRLAWLLSNIRGVVPDHCISFLDTHDVQYERQSRFHERGLVHDIDISPKEEAAALGLANFVIAIQSADKQKLETLVPHAKILVAGLAPPVQPAPRYAPQLSGVIRLGFIGSSMSPNIAAAKRLIENIFRPLRERISNQVELHIYGGVCGRIEASFLGDGVHVHGYAANVADVFATIDIFVNPVETGGGLKIKNVEALSHGVALVTSSIGAEGIEHGAGSAFIVADEDEQYVTTILSLAQDTGRCMRLRNAAWEFSRKYFGDEIVYRQLDDVWLQHRNGIDKLSRSLI